MKTSAVKRLAKPSNIWVTKMATRRRILQGGAAAIAAGLAPRAAWASTEADVLIIGAGLSGLAAARLLEASGARIAIVEAENRIGGRLHTLDDLPGRPEAGGIQVGQGYAILRRIAGELGIGLPEGEGAGAGINQVPGNLYHVNGVSVPSSGWADSAANMLPAAERATEPASLAGLFMRALPRLETPASWIDAPRALDISLRQALIAAGASDEALRLIEANFNGNDLASQSQLNLARALAFYRAGPGPTATIAGGSQRLPEAMAAALANSPRLGSPVRGICEEADGVTVHLAGSTIRARHVICTIPFAALRHVPLASTLTPSAARMIASLPYTRASFAYIRAARPFWREDGLPETLWTDDPLLGRVFVVSDEPAMLKLWTTGAGADMLDRMPPETARAQITARIEAARPSAKGLLGHISFFSWQRSPYARGIYHHIGTGMAADLAACVQHHGQRLHFAGEHLAQGATGMEAALESGERVARLVAAAI